MHLDKGSPEKPNLNTVLQKTGNPKILKMLYPRKFWAVDQWPTLLKFRYQPLS